MYRFLAGLFTGLAFTHLGFALFADMNTVRIVGRTWSAGAVWTEFVVYAALAVVFAYLGWRTKASVATRKS